MLLTTKPLPRNALQDIWDDTGWSPHDLQREILLSRTRNRVVSAGRRAGKSQTGGHALVPEAFRSGAEQDLLRGKGLRREYWIVGPEYSDAEKEFRVLWDALERLELPFDRPGSYNNPQSGEMRVSLWGGRFIVHAKSAKYPGTLVGEGLSGVVFSEAAKLKPSVWTKFIRPTLADFQGWAFFGSTPEGKNWFYDLWALGQDPTRPDWASWRAPSWVNPHVYPGGVNEELLERLIDLRRKHKLDGIFKAYEVLRGPNRTLNFFQPGRQPSERMVRGQINEEIWSMFLDMSQELFNQEVAALFTEYVGRVFKDFDEDIHVTDQEYRSDWITYACADYGFTNPFVWLILQVDPHGERIHVVDELYERNLTTEEACDAIQSRGLAPRSLRTFYPDPSEPDRTRTLEQRLRVRSSSPGSLEIKDRVEWIRRKLKVSVVGLDTQAADPKPLLTVHRRCRNAIRELNDYRYKETHEQASEKGRSAPENPMKKDDHCPEALGRFFSGRFGNPHREYGTRQTKARVGRR